MRGSREHGDALRPVLLAAARRLIADARAARARLDMHDPDRTFYLGVEAAAEEVIHPELRAVRDDEWTASNPAEFRSGYLRTSALLASWLMASEPATALRLPEPDHR